jgi:hypothetical protein
VNISPGQTLNFQVFFANTGTTTWSRGTGTQVDLAACLEDKTTCNAQDATEASWNSGWLSSTRYASTVQTTTAPGALGTFSYNITAPANVTAGTYRFNGDLVLSSTGEKIHPDGYYQDATVGGGGTGATIVSLNPSGGPTDGGNSVIVTGTGFVCTPAFPAVSFGGTNASVTSCGSTSVTAIAPAHAAGSVTVTLTNSGSTASNGLTYTYSDQGAPSFTGQSTTGNFVTVTFSEPVCNPSATNTAPADWTVQNVSAATPIPVSSDTIPTCTTAQDASVSTATLFLGSAIPPGAFVEVRLNSNSAVCVPTSLASCNVDITDVAGNTIKAPQAQTATAGTPETTPPTITSATGAVGSSTIVLNFSEAVWCNGVSPNSEDFVLTGGTGTPPTIVSFGSDPCLAAQSSADSSFNLTTSTNLPADTVYTLTVTAESGQIQDVAGNSLANPSSVTFTTGAADFTPPTMIDARMVNNAGPSTDFTEQGDSFSVTFSEKMNGATNGLISIQDQDGSTATIQCGGVQATCTWNTAVTTMTVTLITAPTFGASPNGTTPGMQIPFNITATTQIQDTSTNPPNVLGSSDRLVDYE